MTKKTIVFLVGAVVFAFVAIAVYASTDTSQTPTNDTSITNAEVCSQDCGKDCERCEDCDGNCEDCDGCDKPCEGHGDKCGGHGDGGKCGGHGDGGKGCGSGGGCGGGDN